MSRLVAIAAFLALGACRAQVVGPYTTLAEESRSTTEAEQLNRRAADLLGSDPAEAEALLREALTKDVFYGPAHNNLGVVFLAQGKLYEAANEFEWARKLLPDSPDPRINLALVMEQAGRTDEALRAYETALEVVPECVAAMQGAAALCLRGNLADQRLDPWLERIALAGENADWRAWALERRARR